MALCLSICLCLSVTSPCSVETVLAWRLQLQLIFIFRYNLEPVPTCRRFETRYVQIQCNTGTYSQIFFPSAIWLWNSLPVDICQLPPGSFKTSFNSFHFTRPRPVFIVCTALICLKLLFVVYYTAFSVHICLFTRGVILFEIESAPLSYTVS